MLLEWLFLCAFQEQHSTFTVNGILSRSLMLSYIAQQPWPQVKHIFYCATIWHFVWLLVCLESAHIPWLIGQACLLLFTSNQTCTYFCLPVQSTQHLWFWLTACSVVVVVVNIHLVCQSGHANRWTTGGFLPSPPAQQLYTNAFIAGLGCLTINTCMASRIRTLALWVTPSAFFHIWISNIVILIKNYRMETEYSKVMSHM